jgi:AmmeMemoRadiSam system protein B
MEHTENIRQARFAGSWYPDDPAELESFVDVSLAEARERGKQARPSGCFAMLPHAGLMFSGRGIASFFVQFPPQAERILVLAPSHYHLLESDVLTVGSFDAYKTPLGTLKGFSLHSGRKGGEQAIRDEHAVEMVLPFVAAVQAKRKRPLSVCTALVSQIRSVVKAEEIARTLYDELGKEELESGRSVVMASSDFTHYGFRFGYTPYAGLAPSKIRNKVKDDDLFLSGLLRDGNLAGALEFSIFRHSTVCGLAAGLVVSSLASHCGASGTVVDYYDSNDILENDADEFVAYSTIVWSRT